MIVRLAKDKALWLLLFISCAVRIYVWHTTPVIGRDGIDFINIANAFADGNLSEGLTHPFHPLYPLFISFGSKIGIEFEPSGRLISLLFGVIAVLAIYSVGQKMFDKDEAFISAFIMTIHPYAVRLSVDVMSDSLYFSFYIIGFGLGYVSIVSKRLHLFFLTGIASAFAYLTRPEGISILLITSSWMIVQRIKGHFKSLKPLCFMLAGFLLFASPYLLYLKHETGTWTLTKKKQISEISGMSLIFNNNPATQSEQQGEDVAGSRGKNISEKGYMSTLAHIMDQYVDSLHYPLLLFLLVGIASIIKNPVNKVANIYILSYAISFFFVLYLLQLIAGYASYRHLMNVTLVTLFWVGTGVSASYYWLINKGSRLWGHSIGAATTDGRGRRKEDRNCKLVGHNLQPAAHDISILSSKSGIIFLCLVTALLLPKTLKSHRNEKIIRKEAGLWLKKYDHDAPVIITDRPIIAYYANGRWFQTPVGDYEGLIRYARAKDARYLIITENITNICPDFFFKIDHNDMEKIFDLKDKDNMVIIYRLKIDTR